MITNGVMTFTVEYKDLFGIQANGYGKYIPSSHPTAFSIPAEKSVLGLPQYAPDFQKVFGKYHNYTYAVKAAGSVSHQDCNLDRKLLITYASVIADNSDRDNSAYFSRNVPISGTAYSGKDSRDIDSDWVQLNYYGPDFLSYLQIGGECRGDGILICGEDNFFYPCKFESYGGWSGVRISLRITFNIEIFSPKREGEGYCTQKNKYLLQDSFCYNLLSKYITDAGANGNLDSYLKSYCESKFPTDNLSLFNSENKGTIIDDKDYNICACNMPAGNYEKFFNDLRKIFPSLNLETLKNIKPECLFPPCLLSNFKNSNLGEPPDACPVPQCLSIVTITDGNISGDVEINQEADCRVYGFEKVPNTPGNPNTPDKSPPYLPPGQAEREEKAQGEISTIDDTTIIIIVVVVIIVVVAIIVGIYFGVQKRKSYSGIV